MTIIIEIFNHDELVEKVECDDMYSFECTYLTDDPTASIKMFATLRSKSSKSKRNILWELVPRIDAEFEPEFTLHVHTQPDDNSNFVNFVNYHPVTRCHVPGAILCNMPHRAFTGVAEVVVSGSVDLARPWTDTCPPSIQTFYM
jgi:hypothetical protein